MLVHYSAESFTEGPPPSFLSYPLTYTFLEDTLAVTEWRDVSGSILLEHGLASKLLSNHVSKNSHHGSSAVVELNVELSAELFGVGDLTSEPTDTVVAVVLGCGQPCQFKKTNEKEDLSKSSGGDLGNSSHSGGDVRELQVVGRRKVSIEDDVVVVDDHTSDGSHGNTSVLALNRSAALEGLRFRFEPSKGVENTKGLGDTKLELTDLEGRGGLGSLGRGESGGGSGKEGGDGELHLDCFCGLNVYNAPVKARASFLSESMTATSWFNKPTRGYEFNLYETCTQTEYRRERKML